MAQKFRRDFYADVRSSEAFRIYHGSDLNFHRLSFPPVNPGNIPLSVSSSVRVGAGWLAFHASRSACLLAVAAISAAAAARRAAILFRARVATARALERAICSAVRRGRGGRGLGGNPSNRGRRGRAWRPWPGCLTRLCR